MYIMITNKCNMVCPHCCYACGLQGEDMPIDCYRGVLDRWGNVLKRAPRSQILIGGGEPTIHPDFWKILSFSMSRGRTWLATNGKETETALILIEMAKKNMIDLTLSLDKWHAPISAIVVNKMKEGLIEKSDGRGWISQNRRDNREIRTVKDLKYGGRYRGRNHNCPCPRIHVKPNGNIHGCGCEDAPLIGTVKEGFFKKYEKCIPLLKDPPIFRICSKKWAKDLI